MSGSRWRPGRHRAGQPIDAPRPPAPQAQQHPLTIGELCGLFHVSPDRIMGDLVRLRLRSPADASEPRPQELVIWRQAREQGDYRITPRM